MMENKSPAPAGKASLDHDARRIRSRINPGIAEKADDITHHARWIVQQRPPRYRYP
jgi:hypothetical protein